MLEPPPPPPPPRVYNNTLRSRSRQCNTTFLEIMQMVSKTVVSFQIHLKTHQELVDLTARIGNILTWKTILQNRSVLVPTCQCHVVLLRLTRVIRPISLGYYDLGCSQGGSRGRNWYFYPYFRLKLEGALYFYYLPILLLKFANFSAYTIIPYCTTIIIFVNRRPILLFHTVLLFDTSEHRP